MILIGSARSDSRGKYAGDEAGDQRQSSVPDLQGEVSMQKMYQSSKGWYIIRPKQIEHASRIALSMQAACNNPNIGYDQNDRLQIISKGTATNTPCDCDCSSLVRQCIKEGTGKDVGNFTTQNERTKLISSGLMLDIGGYISQDVTPIYDGDILVTKTKGHTVIVVSGNPRTAKGEYYPKYSGSSKSIADALRAVGEKDVSMEHRTQIAKANGIINYKGAYDQNIMLLRLLKMGNLQK